MIAQHDNDGQLQGAGQFLDEQVSFLGQAIIGQVAAEHQHVGELVGMLEEGPDQAMGILAAMEIADRRDANDRP